MNHQFSVSSKSNVSQNRPPTHNTKSVWKAIISKMFTRFARRIAGADSAFNAITAATATSRHIALCNHNKPRLSRPSNKPAPPIKVWQPFDSCFSSNSFLLRRVVAVTHVCFYFCVEILLPHRRTDRFGWLDEAQWRLWGFGLLKLETRPRKSDHNNKTINSVSRGKTAPPPLVSQIRGE